MSWQEISTAPTDGTRIMGRRTYAERYTGQRRYEKHKTFWGKTSHVPIYGWNYGRDPENQDLWNPTHWKPIARPEGQ